MKMEMKFRINKYPPIFNKISAYNSRLGAQIALNTEHVSFFVRMK